MFIGDWNLSAIFIFKDYIGIILKNQESFNRLFLFTKVKVLFSVNLDHGVKSTFSVKVHEFIDSLSPGFLLDEGEFILLY